MVVALMQKVMLRCPIVSMQSIVLSHTISLIIQLVDNDMMHILHFLIGEIPPFTGNNKC